MKSVFGRPAKLATLAGASLTAVLALTGCSSATPAPGGPSNASQPLDSPLVAMQPGAWFDGDGNLSVVSTGRRLRLVLSAPIAACAAAFDGDSRGEELSQKASLPFHALGEACRQSHPTILLREESENASPSELERSYHDVARCAALELSASTAWVPNAIAEADPCPLALGLGWRLPEVAQLQGLGIDERKAVAGALFDMEDRGFGSLVLYARDGSGSLALVTLSPNSSERAPELTAEQRSKPYAPAVLRCVRDAAPTATVPRSNPPPLPEAAACLKALRLEQASLHATPAAPPPELVQLEAWLKQASHSPNVLYTEPGQRELLQLLAAPTIETLAREAREEQSLTERYAELADALDAPDVSPSERQRRQAEFDTLRKRLSGQIARSAMASSAQRRQLSALLARLQSLLFDTEQAKKAAKKAKRAFVDPAPVQRRVQELQGAAAAAAPRPATSAKPAAR